MSCFSNFHTAVLQVTWLSYKSVLIYQCYVLSIDTQLSMNAPQALITTENSARSAVKWKQSQLRVILEEAQCTMGHDQMQNKNLTAFKIIETVLVELFSMSVGPRYCQPKCNWLHRMLSTPWWLTVSMLTDRQTDRQTDAIPLHYAFRYGHGQHNSKTIRTGRMKRKLVQIT